MTATPARIGFIKEQFRRAVSTSPGAQARYGSLARQTDDPVETWFDDVADAQAVADARQALLSPDRRRFRTTVVSLDEAIALDYVGAVPNARFVDTERGFDKVGLVTEVTINLNEQTATIGFWG